MNTKYPDPYFQTPKELAGAHYDALMRTKETAMSFLSTSDDRLCLAAACVCHAVWKCGPDPKLTQACRRIATSRADESTRIYAISLLGTVLDSSRSRDNSRFLADLAMDSTNGIEVRREAYWALVRVERGEDGMDFDVSLKNTIRLVKRVIRAFPTRFSEQEAKLDLTPQPGFPEDYWESADDIDWDFVARFASNQG